MYDIKTLNHTPLCNNNSYQSPFMEREHIPLEFMSPSRLQAPLINPPTYGIQGEYIRNVMGDVVGTYNPLFRRY